MNLLVTPEQAETLSLASNETRIQLILRNPLDNEATKTPGSAMSTLFGEAKPLVAHDSRARVKAAPPAAVLPPPPPPSPFLIEVLNGAKRTEVKFARRLEEQQQ